MDKECGKYWKKERPLMLEAHMSRAKERWEAVFSPDYDWEFSLVSIRNWRIWPITLKRLRPS